MSAGDTLFQSNNASRGGLPKGNTDEAIRFLEALSGRHNLWARDPDSGFNEGRTFEPNSWDAIRKWVDARQGRMNIYFSVNEPKAGINKKLEKGDIARIRAVHLDLDVPKDERQGPDRLAELKAALRGTIDEIEADDAAPEIGAIIDSGGGFNLLWILDEPLLASQGNIADVEAQNYGLLKRYGADKGTHNIDRVLRLAGTVNIPDKTKKARGREPSLASLVDLYPYDPPSLDTLAEHTPPVAPPTSAEGQATKLEIDMNAVSECVAFGDLSDNLQAKLSTAREADNALDRLWNGDRSAYPGSDDSGSGFAFALAGALKQHGGFTPTEFGQLLHVWAHSSSDKTKIDGRYIERSWTKSRDPAPSGGEEFAPLSLMWVQPIDANSLRRREWVCGRFTAKRYVTVLVAPAGVGKTTFLLMMAVAVVTGRSDIIGFDVPRRERVLLFNQEDELDELRRRLLAVMAQFNVSWSDLLIDGQPALVMESGAEQRRVFARRNGDRIVATDAAVEVEEFIKENNIGLAIFDPFVELHGADENDNVQIAAVGGVFRRLAVSGSCGVVLAHHPRKPPNAANRESYAGDMDATRGAGALTGVSRMGATLYGIDAATAKKYGIKEEEKHRYIRFDDGKANMSLLSGEPRFFRRESVVIGGVGGEEIGVLVPVKLERAKSSAESKTQEDTKIREAVVSLLRKAEGHRAAITSVADGLLEAGVVDLTAPETLRKRLNAMFEKPLAYENGDNVRCETGRIKGKPGRSALLILDIAEK